MEETDSVFPLDALAGLAEKWEGSAEIRQRFRDDGGLLIWPTPSSVGVPSMILE